jgi:hypothetical protein
MKGDFFVNNNIFSGGLFFQLEEDVVFNGSRCQEV